MPVNLYHPLPDSHSTVICRLEDLEELLRQFGCAGQAVCPPQRVVKFAAHPHQCLVTPARRKERIGEYIDSLHPFTANELAHQLTERHCSTYHAEENREEC